MNELRRSYKPRIKKVKGSWYAFGHKGRQGGYALGKAISFCGKLNRGELK